MLTNNSNILTYSLLSISYLLYLLLFNRVLLKSNYKDFKISSLLLIITCTYLNPIFYSNNDFINIKTIPVMLSIVFYCLSIFGTIFIEKMVKNFKVFSICFITLIILSLLIYKTTIPLSLYFYLFTFITFYIIINYDIKNNLKLYFIYSFTVLTFSAILFLKLFREDQFPYNDKSKNICLIIFIVFIVVLTFFCIFQYNKNRNISPKKGSYLENNNYTERTNDLKRLQQLLDKPDYNLIGLQAIWGNGKTYLFNMLQELPDIVSQYTFITIGVLSVTVDNVESFILNEINKVLEDNRIFSISSRKIQSLKGQSIFYGLDSLFIGKSS